MPYLETSGYFFAEVPGVILASSGEDGLICPWLFSGLRAHLCWPSPAVAGLSPFGPAAPPHDHPACLRMRLPLRVFVSPVFITIAHAVFRFRTVGLKMSLQ